MTDRMRYLYMCLRVVLVMLGINLGIVFATLVTGSTDALVITLLCTFVALCSWAIVEIQIRGDQS